MSRSSIAVTLKSEIFAPGDSKFFQGTGYRYLYTSCALIAVAVILFSTGLVVNQNVYKQHQHDIAGQ
jgi:hypothetical protein